MDMEECWENTMGQGAIMGVYFFIITLLGEPAMAMMVNIIIGAGLGIYLVLYHQLEGWTALRAGLQFMVGILAVFVGALMLGHVYGFIEEQVFQQAVNTGLGFGAVFALTFGVFLLLKGERQPLIAVTVMAFSGAVTSVLLVLILLR